MALVPVGYIYVLFGILLTYAVPNVMTRMLGSVFMGIAGARLAIGELWLDTTTLTLKEVNIIFKTGSWGLNTIFGFVLLGLSIIMLWDAILDFGEYRRSKSD